MSGLPEGWINTQIGQVITLNEKLKGIDDEIECGFVPMALMPTAYRGFVNFETKTWGSCKKGFTQFKDDDVLLAKITPCFENGKGGIVTGLPNGIGAGSTEYFVLRCIDELIQPQYLHAFVKSKKFMDDCEVHMGGSVGHKRVPKDYLLKYEIPLAPLNEQIRITNKLDSILAKVDKAQARLDKIPAILKRFRQSVLAAATSGELTKEWRAENPSQQSIDLDALTSLKESLIKQKQVKKDLIVKKIDCEGLPDSWVTVNLGGLASKVTDGEHKTPKRTESGRFLLSARNVRDGRIDLSKVDYVGDEEFEKLRKRCDPNKGDILISCSGSVGRIALCDCDDEYVMVRSAALVKTDLTEQNNTYLMYVLQSPRLQDIIVEKSKATAQSNLFLAPIKELPIPIAPVLEQSEIVRKVEALLAKANKVEKQYLDAKARLDRLTQSILAKAFRGELVPQDPNDEPAEKLLERILEEREQAKPKKKVTRKRTTKAKTAEKE